MDVQSETVSVIGASANTRSVASMMDGIPHFGATLYLTHMLKESFTPK